MGDFHEVKDISGDLEAAGPRLRDERHGEDFISAVAASHWVRSAYRRGCG